MKRVFFTLLMIVGVTVQCFSVQYKLCVVTRNLNLRNAPFPDGEIVCVMPEGSYVVLKEYEHVKFAEGYVSVLYIDKDISGYASSTYLKFVQNIETDESGVLEKAGVSEGLDPEIEITNDTNRNITVRINGKSFPFTPRQVMTITCEAGSVDILASSPGVIPYSAKDFVEENALYTWKFYIKTRYR